MCLFADAAEKEAYLARHNGKEYVTVWKIVASFDDREYLTPMIRKKSQAWQDTAWLENVKNVIAILYVYIL